MKSVKGKILLSIVLLVSVSLVFVGASSVYMNYSSTVDTLEQSMKETAQIAAERVEQELMAYKNVSQVVGTMPRLSSQLGSAIKVCADRLVLLSQGDSQSDVPKVKSKDETKTLADATRLIVDTISGIIKDLKQQLIGVAEGDLTVDSQNPELYVGDFNELQTSMGTILTTLNTTLTTINVSSDQVALGSDQISAGAQALSQGTTEQASSVEELAATIGDISTHVKNTASLAQGAASQINMTAEELEESNQQMQLRR